MLDIALEANTGAFGNIFAGKKGTAPSCRPPTTI
jgi:hypothetical protein